MPNPKFGSKHTDSVHGDPSRAFHSLIQIDTLEKLGNQKGKNKCCYLIRSSPTPTQIIPPA